MGTIEQKTKELVEAVRANSGKEDVAFRLFINYQEEEVEVTRKSTATLKQDFSSMKNLAGEWIK